MKNNSCLIFFTLLLYTFHFSCIKKDSTNSAGNDINETLPPVQIAVNTTISANCAGFYRALPARYDSTTKKYPLLVYLHGAGEMGNGTTDLSNVLHNALPHLINNHLFPANFISGGKNFSFIVISPQFKSWPASDDVEAVVQYAIKKFRIDESRIYVTGLSMGGGATWDYAALHAGKIAAIVPICGASSPTTAKAQSIADAGLPVWAFHNDDDYTVSVNVTKQYISMINSFSPTPAAKMTIWPTGGHDAWTKASDPAYKENNLNIYEWMLQYHR